jgi:hypothetical protein
MYSNLVITHQKHYFVKYHSDFMHKYSEIQIKMMLEFLIHNIQIAAGGQAFKQSVGLLMGMNCVPLLAACFLYSYDGEVIQKLLNENKTISCCGYQFDISIYRRHFLY